MDWRQLPESIIEALPNLPASAKKHLKAKKKKAHIPSCVNHVEEGSINDVQLISDGMPNPTESTRLSHVGLDVFDIPSENNDEEPKVLLNKPGKSNAVKKEEKIYTFHNCQFTYLRPTEDGFMPEISQTNGKNPLLKISNSTSNSPRGRNLMLQGIDGLIRLTTKRFKFARDNSLNEPAEGAIFQD